MTKARQKAISIVLTIIFVLSLATPVLASDPASIDGVIFDVDGEFILVGLIEYATAYAEKNALYTYLSGAIAAPTITAVASAGKYIDLTEYAIKYAEEGNDVSAAINASTAMTEEDLAGYLELISFDYDDGAAVLELLYPEAPADLEVVSVQAINLKEVEVTFSEPMCPITAQNAANYVFSGFASTDAGTLNAPSAYAEFADGSNTVVRLLTAGDTAKMATTDTNAKISITGVKDATGSVSYTSPAAGVAIGEIAADGTMPQVVEVRHLGTDHFELVYSEAVIGGTGINAARRAGAYKIGEMQLTGAGADGVTITNPSGDLRTFLFAFAGTATDIVPLFGEKDIWINNHIEPNDKVQDFGGNNVPITKKTVTFAEDTTRPTVVGVTLVDRQNIDVTFSEMLDGSFDATKAKWGTTTYGKSTKGADSIAYRSGSTYRINFVVANAFPSEGEFKFWIPKVEVVDLSGNFMLEDYEITLNGIPSPAMTITASGTTSDVVITFSRDISSDLTNIQAKGNYKIDGAALPTVATVVKTSPTVVTITTALAHDDHTVSISGLKDAFGDVIPDLTATFNVTDTVLPTVTTKWHQNNATIGGQEYDVLVLEFSMPMMTGNSTGSIEVASNYRFKESGAPTATDSLPEGTSLTAFGGDKWVKIVMPQTTTANFNTDQLAMGYLVDTTYYGVASYAGVPLGTESITLDGTNDARQAIAFAGLTGEIVDDKTVVVDLGTLRNGFGAVSAGDFAAVKGVTPITITGVALSDESDNDNKDRMTFTFAAGTFEAGDTVDITLTASANTTDLFGINITGGVNNITTNKIVAEMIKASVQSTTTIRVQFSESMAFVGEADFRVGDETPTAAVVVTGDSKVWDLTIAAIALDATPIVKTVAVPQSEDVYSNKLTANTTGLTAGNMAVQAVALSQGANIALEGDEKIVITFDSAVDPDSIVSGWTGAAAIPVNVKLYDSLLIVPGSVNALADGDVIVLPGIGKLDWGTVDVFAAVMTAVGPTTGDLTTATYALSTDKKTLTVTLVGINLAADSIAEGIKGTPTLTITNDEIKSAVTEPAIADYINVGKTGITATRLATPAIDVTVNAVLNRIDFVVNWKYAGGIIAAGELDFFDIYAKINEAHADFSGANGTFTAGVVGLLGSLVVGNLNDAKVGVNVAASTVTGTGDYSSVSGTVPSFDVSVVAFTGFNNAITID